MEKPEFGPILGTNSTGFDFKNEIDQLPFQLNIGKETNLMWDQQSHFVNLVYDNKDVFSLHNEDLGYCDLIKHMIPATTEKACVPATFYYPHTTSGWSMYMCGCLVVPGHY